MIRDDLSEIPVYFYQTASGAAPVLDWLRSLPPDDRRASKLTSQRCSSGSRSACLSAGRLAPVCGRFAVRSLAGASPGLLFFVAGGRIGAVHGFIKKTRATPADDLDIARNRMKEMQA